MCSCLLQPSLHSSSMSALPFHSDNMCRSSLLIGCIMYYTMKSVSLCWLFEWFWHLAWTGPRDLEALKAYALEAAAEVTKAGTDPDEAAL